MKLNAEMIRVAPHFLLIDQFLGLLGSSGPSQVTFHLLAFDLSCSIFGWKECWTNTCQIWIFGFLNFVVLFESMNTICTVDRSLRFEVLRCARLLSSCSAVGGLSAVSSVSAGRIAIGASVDHDD